VAPGGWLASWSMAAGWLDGQPRVARCATSEPVWDFRGCQQRQTNPITSRRSHSRVGENDLHSSISRIRMILTEPNHSRKTLF
jgi:hypothetical protein